MLIFKSKIEIPESIEMAQYMLEFVVQLEIDGHLTTPEANKIIGMSSLRYFIFSSFLIFSFNFKRFYMKN